MPTISVYRRIFSARKICDYTPCYHKYELLNTKINYKMEEILQNASIVDLQNVLNEKLDAENSIQLKKIEDKEMAVIKLDRNFHVYCHGGHDSYEKGKDENGNYLKLYFEKLS